MPKQMEVKLYLDDGWTISKIEETLKARTSIKEYAMILHDKDSDENGAHVKDHFHLLSPSRKNGHRNREKD